MKKKRVIVIERIYIRILVIEKEKQPYEKRVNNRLESFRKIVGSSNIGVVLFDGDSLIIFDEDADKKALEVNRIIKMDKDYNIRGTFIITGNDVRKQDFKSLTDKQIEYYKEEFEITEEKELEEENDMELE